MNDRILHLHNCEAVALAAVPVLDFAVWREALINDIAEGAHLSSLFVYKNETQNFLCTIISIPQSRQLGISSCAIGDSYPALTPECPSAHWFEREIFEKNKIRPEGHPWLKPIRFLPDAENTDHPQIGVTDFFSMHGEEVHEVAVGPVHAGVIEPGHFRFQCHGETVYHLEISLGYQHRGVERAMLGGPHMRSLHYVETLAGDTSAAHTSAYCAIVEALSGSEVPRQAQLIRAIACELERMANHIGDLGGLATDVGFLPTANYCGRIRGDVLNLSALICGNRFGRNLIIPGGVRYAIETERRDVIKSRLGAIEKDLINAVPLMFETPSVITRFDGTGRLSAETAREIGLVGVAARACGLENDVRKDLPYGLYAAEAPEIVFYHNGDCYARGYVRWLEILSSIAYIRRCLEYCDNKEEYFTVCGNVAPEHIAVALTEGWRGEICHVAISDESGNFNLYKITDPSFHNWFGLALALRGQQISDFPLCNKSFSLSYCGHDL